MDFRISGCHAFSTPKGGRNHEKGAHSDPKSGSKRGPFRVLDEAQRIRASRRPVFMKKKKQNGNRKSLEQLLLQIHQLYSVGKYAKHMGILSNGSENNQSTTLTKDGHFHCKSENVVPIVVPGIIVDRSSLKRCHCSIGRPTAESYVRETQSKLFQTGLNSLTEGVVEGESGSSSSAGDTIPKRRAPRFPARPSNNSGGKHNLFHHLRRTPILVCANAQKSPKVGKTGYSKQQQLEIPLHRVTKFSMKTTNRGCIIDMP